MPLELSSIDALHADLSALQKSMRAEAKLVPIAGTADGKPVLFKMQETEANREHRYHLMNKVLEHPLDAGILQKGGLNKSSVNVAGNIYGYDLRAPAMLHIPFLSPLRDVTPRVQHSQPGNAANWKVISAGSYVPGSFPASPWINEGARAPRFAISATTKTAPYTTIGIDGSDTYEAESAGRDFESPLATAQFIGLEKLMVMEEDALVGGNNTLKLGTANTPTGVAAGSGSFTATLYAVCVALSYEGYRNQSATTGIIQQKTITTPDGKTMTINGGCGQQSAASSSVGPSSSLTVTWSVVPKAGEIAYAWYVGTSASASAMYLQAITTNPTYVMTATRTTTGQFLSALTAADYSVNDGTTGSGTNQVTAFDGFLTQIINASQLATPNSYYKNLAGGKITASGRGSIEEIDAAFRYAWDNFKTTFDAIYVNSQELINITTGVLNNASGPLVRYEVSADGGHYDMTASGTIAFYFNPFVNGGSKIPIIVHPTLPAGTILLQGTKLPPYFKRSNMTTTAEIICRRDYYSIMWANVTREYEFGTYSEEVLAMYAPFAFGVITGIADGVGV